MSYGPFPPPLATYTHLGRRADRCTIHGQTPGGRTAWTSSVSVFGSVHRARFWYDGKNLQNAKDDAAEVALNWLDAVSAPCSPATSRSSGW